MSLVLDSNKIVFLGSPMIDITAKIPQSFLTDHQLDVDNAYVVTDKTKTVFDHLEGYQTDVQIGGSVTNTLRTLRKLAPSVPLTYLGAVGRDDYADLIRDRLKFEKIDFEFAEIPYEMTGKVAVLLAGKHRTLLTDLGASRQFTLKHLVGSDIWKSIECVQYVYISAFFIGVSMEVIKTIVDHFVKSKKAILFNLGAPFLSSKFKDEVKYLFKSSQIVFGNQSEFAAFAENNDIPGSNITQILLNIRTIYRRFPLMVVTNGGDSVVVANNEIKWHDLPKLSKDKIVNTNGAGDVFVGGFLSSFLTSNNEEEETKLRKGVESGIEAATRLIQNSKGDILQRLVISQ